MGGGGVGVGGGAARKGRQFMIGKAWQPADLAIMVETCVSHITPQALPLYILKKGACVPT